VGGEWVVGGKVFWYRSSRCGDLTPGTGVMVCCLPRVKAACCVPHTGQRKHTHVFMMASLTDDKGNPVHRRACP